MDRAVVVGLVSLLLATSGGQLSLREGILRTGIAQGSFLAQWGPPDRTVPSMSGETLQARWGLRSSGGVVKGKRSLELWTYERHGVELVFEDRKLVSWRTDKTVSQLRAIAARR